jgi:hypothetical protein
VTQRLPIDEAFMSGNQSDRDKQEPTPAQPQDGTTRPAAPHVVTQIGPVIVLLCRAGITKEAVHELAQAIERGTQGSLPRRVGLLVVLAPDIDVRLPGTVRDAMSQLVAQYQAGIAATAVAFEAKGFTATIVRSVVTAIALTSSTRFPYKIEDSAERGLQWLIEQLGGAGPVAQAKLQQLLREWRAAHVASSS